jgi:hypothetical protein
MPTSAPQGLQFTTYRLGQRGLDLTARDIELLWDPLYGPFTPDQQLTLGRFVDALVTRTGTNPTASDATNLQALYNVLRREGANWETSNPADSLA